METQSRREFLCRMAGLTAVAGLGALAPQTAEAGWFGSRVKEDAWQSLGKLDALADGKATVIHEVTTVPQGKVIKKPKLIAWRKGNQVSVMSTRCTHWGGEVQLEAGGTYKCPWHGSVFDLSGNVLKAPAKKPLPWYETSVTETGDVQINVTNIVSPPSPLPTV
jgi:Rieske Fe-S protein